MESPRRGYFRITERGRQLLQAPPPGLDAAFLRQNFQEFRDFVAKPTTDAPEGQPGIKATG